MPTPEEIDKYSANSSWCNKKQQASQLLSMHNYTPLVINGNVQLLLLSQRKLELTAINTLFAM
jgi:hypothetical protein